MTNEITRRDWFRLKKAAHTPRVLGNEKTAVNQARLQPIEHPPNHDGLDLNELPPMVEATLLVEDVQALFSDIAALGENVMLMQRSSRTAKADAAKVNTRQQLKVAKDSLLTGSIERVQVRYDWQGSKWIDTLELKPDGYRLVRIAHG